jgi:hypothetical protein
MMRIGESIIFFSHHHYTFTQSWSHATNALGKLNQAIKENVNAIECDVILGEDGEPILLIRLIKQVI